MKTYILLVQQDPADLELSDNKDGWAVMEATTNPDKADRWEEDLTDVLTAKGIRNYLVVGVGI